MISKISDMGMIGSNYLSVDELNVVGALSITVTGSVLGTSLVGGVLGHTTICIHLGEVKSAVETARKLGDVNVEAELLVLHVENLVLAVAGHEVHTGPDVGVGTLGDKLKGKSGTSGGDTIGSRVVGTIKSAV
jgi:hypothetical protein